ncbi:lamin tail domain-containing protein [Nocardioides conyzicola]|uniref:LTD domain-containing protein n=1 Tax=Nocardioides conyzicola TaxID=1651781 RepID=A0ABP8XVF2_9ACTN
MRSPLRGLVAATCSAVVVVSLPILAVLATPVAADAAVPGAGVVLNEVKSNPNPDFVELLNTSSSPVDITGWKAVDDDPSHTPLVITTATTVLAPGEFFTFNPNDATAYPSGSFGLGSNDQITIFLPDGTTVVDAFNWEGIGAPGNHADPSYGRCPGYATLQLNLAATPGAANSCPPPGGGVVLNEVKSNPNPDFVELLNTSSKSVDITGWKAVDDDPSHTPLVITTATTVLAPGGYFTFNPNDTTAYPSGSFGLGSNDQITIFLPDGTTVVDGFNWEGIGAPGNHADPSYGRCANGTGTMVLNLAATPGAANSCPVVAPPEAIKINEVESNGDPVADWVELTNTGGTAVDVSGWQLRDGGESNPAVTIPSGTTIAPGGFYAIYTEIPGPGFGLGVDDQVTLYKTDGTAAVDSYSWGPHAATTYGRCPDGTGDFRVTTVSTRGGPNACSPIRVNEVVTSGTPDQVELVNISGEPIDVAGWVVKDSTDASPTTLPSPSVVPAHGYLVVTPNATLDAADSVRLFDTTSALIDSATWTTAPTPSLGRCADGVGAFKQTESVTIGAANACPGLTTEPWPGSPTVAVSDDAATFNQDASGLAFDPADAGTLWVAQNKLGTLWKMTKSGSTWVPAAGWSKTPKYHDGTGAPDSEGITVGPDGAVYLATERDNSNSGVSKMAVLRYDANGATGSTLNATDEWNLNSLLPSVGANLGLEGITWIPDSFLVGGGFVDESTSAAYDPAHYPAHGTGLYAVAVEGTGMVYVLALDQTDAVQETAHVVATVDPRLLTNAGPPSVMDVSYDAEQKRLWAICDDSCNGTSVLLELSGGKFVVDHAYERPAGMPNLNNEGFAVAPQSTCVAGKKEVVWSDDGDTDGHSLRSGTFPCDKFDATVAAADATVAYGKALSVPVDVTADGTTPTGSVSIKDGDTVLGSATLTAGHASVSVPAGSLQPGTHTLTVAYAGDDHVATGTDSIQLTVTKAVGSVAAADTSVVYGQAVSLPVTVTADGVTPTGSVSVKDGDTVLGSAPLASGQASVTVPASSLQPGTHALTLAYAGDDHVATATDAVTLTVAKAAGTVTATGGSVVYGKTTSVPVTVTATGSAPTGTVTVSSGGKVLGSAGLTGGAATVAIPAKALAPGSHTLSVSYSGSATVAAAETTATLSVARAKAAIAKPSVTPKKVIVKKTKATVTIKVTASGVTPTGKVTLSGGGLAKRTVTLGAGGKVVVKLAVFRTKGTKTLTVTYAGNTYVAGATTKVTIKVVPKK